MSLKTISKQDVGVFVEQVKNVKNTRNAPNFSHHLMKRNYFSNDCIIRINRIEKNLFNQTVLHYILVHFCEWMNTNQWCSTEINSSNVWVESLNTKLNSSMFVVHGSSGFVLSRAMTQNLLLPKLGLEPRILRLGVARVAIAPHGRITKVIPMSEDFSPVYH